MNKQTMRIGLIEAKRMLTKNTRNRTIAASSVKKWRDLMIQGKWNPDADTPLKFGTDGTLLDGQHRLTAISQLPEGRYIECEVWLNCDPAAQQFMDRGNKRNLGQDLSIQGHSNSTTKAALLGPVFYYLDHGKILPQCPQPDLDDSIAWINGFPEFEDIVKASSTLTHKRNSDTWTPAQCGALFTLFTLASDYDTAHAFIKTVCTGIGIVSEKDPAYLLRGWLGQAKINKHRKPTNDHIYHMSIKAWNKHMLGGPVSQLKADKTFPSIIGPNLAPYNPENKWDALALAPTYF